MERYLWYYDPVNDKETDGWWTSLIPLSIVCSMAVWRYATSRYLNQRWPSLLTNTRFTRPRRFKINQVETLESFITEPLLQMFGL